MFEDSNKIRVSSRAIVIHEGAILLNSFKDGAYFNIPGGGIEEREDARQTVVREVFEETGLIVSAGELVFALEYEPYGANFVYGDGHHISFFFRCELLGENQLLKPVQPDVDPLDPSAFSTPVWLPLKELEKIDLVPRVNLNLMQYDQTGRFEPVYWREPNGL